MNLVESERRLIAEILRAHAPDLLEQLEYIKVESRFFSGVGVIVSLSSEKPSISSGIRGYLGLDFELTAPGFPGLFQMHIYVRDGCIEVFEIVALDENTFPDDLSAFSVSRFDEPLAKK